MEKNKHCPKHGKKVCGSDFKTYRNLCELELENCKPELKKPISLIHNGKCTKNSSEKFSILKNEQKCFMWYVKNYFIIVLVISVILKLL